MDDQRTDKDRCNRLPNEGDETCLTHGVGRDRACDHCRAAGWGDRTEKGRLYLTEEPGYAHMIPMAVAVLDDGTEIRMRNLGNRVEIRTWDPTRSCRPPRLDVDPLAGRHVIDVRPTRPGGGT